MNYYMAEKLNPVPGIGIFGGISDAAYADDPKLEKVKDIALAEHGEEGVFGTIGMSTSRYRDNKDGDPEPYFSLVVRSHHDIFEFYGIVFDTEGGKGWGTVVHYLDPIGDSKVVTWWWKDFVKEDGLDYGFSAWIQAVTGIEVYDFQELFSAMTRVKVDTRVVYNDFDEFVSAVEGKFFA